MILMHKRSGWIWDGFFVSQQRSREVACFGLQLSSDQNPGWLGCIGDEKLPSYIGTIISHCKDLVRIPFNQPVEWNATRVLITAHLQQSLVG